jgi:lysophospholipase L1-like esterase
VKSTIPAGSRYVALGSSFAAGPGIAPRAPGSPLRAGRSGRNYPHLVADALGLDLHDVSYSGATAGDLLRPSRLDAAAQLDAITPETRLATITVGGNDVGYLARLTLASLPRPLRSLPPARKGIARLGDPGVIDERFARLEETLVQVGRRLRERATACRVLYVDYLTILPADDDLRRGPPPQEIAAWGRTIAARLSTTMQAAATTTGCNYVPAAAASAEHHAWSAVPWTRRFYVSLRRWAPYHPNAAGMAAVAELVLAALELRSPDAADQTG